MNDGLKTDDSPRKKKRSVSRGRSRATRTSRSHTSQEPTKEPTEEPIDDPGDYFTDEGSQAVTSKNEDWIRNNLGNLSFTELPEDQLNRVTGIMDEEIQKLKADLYNDNWQEEARLR